jgi:hypothetical protein
MSASWGEVAEASVLDAALVALSPIERKIWRWNLVRGAARPLTRFGKSVLQVGVPAATHFTIGNAGLIAFFPLLPAVLLVELSSNVVAQIIGWPFIALGIVSMLAAAGHLIAGRRAAAAFRRAGGLPVLAGFRLNLPPGWSPPPPMVAAGQNWPDPSWPKPPRLWNFWLSANAPQEPHQSGGAG